LKKKNQGFPKADVERAILDFATPRQRDCHPEPRRKTDKVVFGHDMK